MDNIDTIKSSLVNLTELVKRLNDNFGRTVIQSAGSIPPLRKIPLLDMPSFDWVTYGGIHHAAINEFYGGNSCFKTYTSLLYAKVFQEIDWNTFERKFSKIEVSEIAIPSRKKDANYANIQFKVLKTDVEGLCKYVVFIDLEGTLKQTDIDNLGLHPNLLYYAPESAEEAVDVTQALCACEEISLIIFDSLSLTSFSAEMESSMADSQMANNTRAWNKAIRKIRGSLNTLPAESRPTMIIINSQYTGVGMFATNSLKGGNELKLAKSCSVVFSYSKSSEVRNKEGDELYGRKVKLECIKNKNTNVGRISQYYFNFKGCEYLPDFCPDKYADLIDIGIRTGIVTRKGAWLSYIIEGNEVKVNGLDALIKYLQEDDNYLKLYKLIIV